MIETQDLQILTGDSAEMLRAIPSGSVHLVVTSPPYDGMRTCYRHERNGWNFEATALEIFRVLCDGGICCWNVNDQTVEGSETLTSCRQKIFFREQCGFRIHDTQFYAKLNFSNPERVRYHQVVEYVFILSKGAPRCFHPIKDKPNVTAGCIGTKGRNTVTHANGSKGARPRKVNTSLGMRSNLWVGKTRGQEEMCKPLPHRAMMPKWLTRDLIRSWSNAGDLVVDPMAGSGTTGHAAITLGRRAILIDIDPKFTAIAAQPS